VHATTWTTVGLVGAVAFGPGGPVPAGELRLPLREHLAKQRANELVTFPFKAAQGFRIEPWSPLENQRVRLGLLHTGRMVEETEYRGV